MKLKVIQRIMGMLLMIFSFSMLPPVVIGWLMDDIDLDPFLKGFVIVLVVGAVLWIPVRREHRELRLRDGFVIAVLFWVSLSAAGTIPLLLSNSLDLSVGSAFFETVSGFTTSGGTVISGLEGLPRSILFYRMELHWLGGMGILVLAVAILPMLGVGGMQLYRAEAPGPVKDDKLTPRITETAKLLWYVYVALTAACAIAYKLAGMDWFDAVCHSFSVLSTGGFSTHDSGVSFFNSPTIDWITIFFMFLGGVNFSLHFMAWKSRSLRAYLLDSEFLTYVSVLGVVALTGTLILMSFEVQKNFFDALRSSFFNFTSFMTSTGLVTADLGNWPVIATVSLIFVSIVGGCAGSTGGGMKVIRILLLVKQGAREINQLAHPKAQLVVKINHRPVPEGVIKSVWGFASIYVVTYAVFMLGLIAAGHDQVTAFSAVAATLNNMGVGFGEVASGFGGLDEFSKWWLSLAMLMGRLELFTVLALFSPMFWR